VVGRPPAEADLIARAKRGDVRAYEQLVSAHQAIALRTAYLFCGNTTSAEEAAQDGFVKAYRSLPRFRNGAPFRPWLLRIVANEARNRARATKRRAALSLRLAEESGAGDAAPSAEAIVLCSERREQLIAALNRLVERDRLVIACRYFLDLSEDETAVALGLPRGTVKSRLSRAVARLRADLEPT
jgi:RNA polymerase sigma-70 factor (ECF subfamily)